MYNDVLQRRPAPPLSEADFIKSACFCSLAFVIVRRYRNQASCWPGTVRGCSLTVVGVGVKIGVKVVAHLGFIPARSSMSISVQGGRIATAFVSICPPISTDVYLYIPTAVSFAANPSLALCATSESVSTNNTAAMTDNVPSCPALSGSTSMALVRMLCPKSSMGPRHTQARLASTSCIRMLVMLI